VDITEVRVKLMNDKTEKLQAFCSITISDDFVVRDLKIIEGSSGPFVAMPSRKLSDRCPKCGCKNNLRANYCSECGTRLRANRGGRDDKGRTKLHADIAHPINSTCREELQRIVLAAYREEVERSRQEGYVPPKYDDLDEAASTKTRIEKTEPVRAAEDSEKAAEPSQPQPEAKPEERPQPAQPQPEAKPEEQPEERPQPQPSRPQPEAKPEERLQPQPAEQPTESGEEKLDAELDAALDSSLDDFKHPKDKQEDDDFGTGIFT
jgi:stage V sporulation protein G